MDRRSSLLNTGCCALGLVLLFLLGLVAAAEDARAERRVALVIGNGTYAKAPDLPNPPNDARDVGGALERLGFEVQLTLDADIDAMRRSLREFVGRLADADVVLFYYAGHGLQYAGENYLIPTSAALEHGADLHFEAVGLNLVMDLLEHPDRTTFVFLDACRDNPLARSFARSLGATRSTQVGRGLARVEGGIGTLIAFATAPGEVALDGTGQNSPFTGALLEHIDSPGLEVRQMLSRVRDEVYRNTGGEQLPWDSSSLRSDFYFIPVPEREPEAAPPQVAAAAPAASARSSPGAAPTSSAELAFWQAIENSRSPREYELFLEKFPQSVFADLARTRLATLEESAAPGPEREPSPVAPTVAAAAPSPEAKAPTVRREAIARADESRERAPPEAARAATPEVTALVAPSEPPQGPGAPASAARLLDGWAQGPSRGCRERAVSDWSELDPDETWISLASPEGPQEVRALRHRSLKIDAEVVAVIERNLVALIEYKQLKNNRWCLGRVLDSGRFNALINRSSYLVRRSARLGVMGRHWTGLWSGELKFMNVVTGREFMYALTEISSPEGTQGCVVFMGAQKRDRVVGFACGPAGARFEKSDAERFLDRINVEGVLGVVDRFLDWVEPAAD